MPCPICKRPPDTKYRPFCSKRCADVDLAKWLNGSYAVPVEETEEWEEYTTPSAPKTPDF